METSLFDSLEELVEGPSGFCARSPKFFFMISKSLSARLIAPLTHPVSFAGWLLIGASLMGCASDPGDGHQPDAHLEDPVDSGSETDATPDVEPSEPDASPDASCETPCEVPVFDTGSARFALSEAAFGVSAPEQTDSGRWELYVELWEGGLTGCPDETSATPSRTVILSGLARQAETSPVTEADGLSLVLLDYDGDIVTGASPISRASSVTVTTVSQDPCADEACTGALEMLVLDLEGTFEEGSLSGRVEARHCESMDLR
jgi:hypothetical protein